MKASHKKEAGEAAAGEEDCPKLVDTSKLAIVKSLLSTSAFDDLKDKVSDKTLNAVREMNFSHMTEIQSKSIPHLIEGKYVFRMRFVFVNLIISFLSETWSLQPRLAVAKHWLS